MIERKVNFKGGGKHLTEERNLGEAEIIVASTSTTTVSHAKRRT